MPRTLGRVTTRNQGVQAKHGSLTFSSGFPLRGKGCPSNPISKLEGMNRISPFMGVLTGWTALGGSITTLWLPTNGAVLPCLIEMEFTTSQGKQYRSSLPNGVWVGGFTSQPIRILNPHQLSTACHSPVKLVGNMQCSLQRINWMSLYFIFNF